MLISYEDIKQKGIGKSPQTVAAALSAMRVKYLITPEGKPLTTLKAFEAAMKLHRLNTAPDDDTQTVEVM